MIINAYHRLVGDLLGNNKKNLFTLDIVCTSSSLLLLAHLISNTILFVHIVAKFSVNTDELRIKGLDWMKIEFALAKGGEVV